MAINAQKNVPPTTIPSITILIKLSDGVGSYAIEKKKNETKKEMKNEMKWRKWERYASFKTDKIKQKRWGYGMEMKQPK